MARETAKKVARKLKAAERPLRLEYRTAEELAENPRNWRRHPEAQVAALSDAIEEVGWAGACLYNERTGRLIDGHARRKIAKGAIPVLIGSWNDADEAKILATLDPIGAMAQADKARLDALLHEFQTESEALGGLLTALAEQAGAIDLGETAVEAPPAEESSDSIKPSTEDWPELGETRLHSVLLRYTDADFVAFKRFLGCDEIPTNKLGRLLCERIKGLATN